MEKVLLALYYIYQVSLVVLLGQGLIEVADIHTTLGEILIYIGAVVAYVLIPFASIFTSLCLVYYLVEYEYWNLFVAIIYAFPIIVLTLGSFIGISFIELKDKVRNLIRKKPEITLQHCDTIDVSSSNSSSQNLGWFVNYIWELKLYRKIIFSESIS